MDRDFLTSAKNGSGRKGQAYLVKYLTGGRLTQRQAIQAKCYDCNGMGEDNSCDIEECALFPYSQFASKSVAGSIIEDNPLPTIKEA